MPDNPDICPRCGSSQITDGIVYGFKAIDKVKRCAKCGYRWQPKKKGK